MPDFHQGFDPMGLVIDWLDACKERRLSSLIDLYDESATLDCCCEGKTLRGLPDEQCDVRRRPTDHADPMPREIPDLLDFRREPSFVRKSGSRPQRNEVLAHDGDGLRIGRHLQIATTDRKIGLGSTEQVKGFDRAVRRQFGALKESVPVHIINAYFSMATLQGSLRSTLTASYHLERSSFRLKTARRDVRWTSFA